MNIEVTKAEYLSKQHEKDITMLLESYAKDPMGAGRPLDAQVKSSLVKEL